MKASIVQSYSTPDIGRVQTVHVLSNGDFVFSLEDFKKVEDKFSWVDKRFVLSELFRLRPLTDAQKISFVAILEEGQVIRPMLNIEPAFFIAELRSRCQQLQFQS